MARWAGTKPELLSATSRSDFAERLGRAARANRGQWFTGPQMGRAADGRLAAHPQWTTSPVPGMPGAVPRTRRHMFLLNAVALCPAGVDACPGGWPRFCVSRAKASSLRCMRITPSTTAAGAAKRTGQARLDGTMPSR